MAEGGGLTAADMHRMGLTGGGGGGGGGGAGKKDLEAEAGKSEITALVGAGADALPGKIGKFLGINPNNLFNTGIFNGLGLGDTEGFAAKPMMPGSGHMPGGVLAKILSAFIRDGSIKNLADDVTGGHAHGDGSAPSIESPQIGQPNYGEMLAAGGWSGFTGGDGVHVDTGHDFRPAPVTPMATASTGSDMGLG